jgi:hemoglobin-like flavoprotein
MFAILCEAYGWSHADIMRMTPRQTRAYFKQIPALRAAEQQRWLVVAVAASTQNPDAVTALSQRLANVFQTHTGMTAAAHEGGLVTSDPELIRQFLNGSGLTI